MPQDAQRKAWNEAMLSAGGVSSLPKSLQTKTRRSDRRKKRDKARTSSSTKAGNYVEDQGYNTAVWLDALEGVDPLQDEDENAEKQEEYNELEELNQKSKPAKKKRKTRATKMKVGQLPKRFKSRSLASILLEETTMEDGVTHLFVEAAESVTSHLPPRPYCSVTGLPGKYREPKSGQSYATSKALEQIRERLPPWKTITGSGAYHDLVKSLQQNYSEKVKK
mmetsp:Transcript_12255/g.14043  ORF Transcript_12255/g.14043 Transcript_12255/m.14043 type:complete len:222 (-) Transcript_12255:271-936(-)